VDFDTCPLFSGLRNDPIKLIKFGVLKKTDKFTL